MSHIPPGVRGRLWRLRFITYTHRKEGSTLQGSEEKPLRKVRFFGRHMHILENLCFYFITKTLCHNIHFILHWLLEVPIQRIQCSWFRLIKPSHKLKHMDLYSRVRAIKCAKRNKIYEPFRILFYWFDVDILKSDLFSKGHALYCVLHCFRLGTTWRETLSFCLWLHH